MLTTMIAMALGLGAWLQAGLVLRRRREAVGKKSLMRRTETSLAAEASAAPPGTPVEVKGYLRCEEPLSSEVSGQACAYYRSEVIRVYRKVHTRPLLHQTVSSSERFAPFHVEDASGSVGVRGEGAEVDAVEVANRFEPAPEGGLDVKLGGLAVNVSAGERTLGYRYVESVLPVDAPVYVLGAARGDGRIGAPREGGEGRFLISHRSEEQLVHERKGEALGYGLQVYFLLFVGAAFVGSAALAVLT